MTRQKKAFELTMFALFSTQYQNQSRYLQKHVYFFIHQSNQRPVLTRLGRGDVTTTEPI